MSANRLFVITISIAVLCLTGCKRATEINVPEKLLIEVTGNNFEWHIRYAGLDETFGTRDDFLTRQNIALIADTQTTIDLRSSDYLYSFSLPHLGLTEIAVPDLKFSLHFSANETGEFILKGNQMCSYQHPKLLGKIHVLDRSGFASWLTTISSYDHSPTTAD